MEPSDLVISIVGPTASGKSALAMELAQKINGEIVCADSRTIYKGLDIGTAKPTDSDRARVRHHCIDIVGPDQKFSVAQYKTMADRAISGIKKRKKIPILVGGSGLYADAVLYDYSFEKLQNQELDDLGLTELQALAKGMGLKPTEQTLTNSRHLKNYILRGGNSGTRKKQPKGMIFGLIIDKTLLEHRIVQRVNHMFVNGLVEETNTLLVKYGENAPGFLTPGYRPVIDFIKGRIDEEEAKAIFINNDRKLAKRQLTWFKRNPDIKWVHNLEEIEQIIEEKV